MRRPALAFMSYVRLDDAHENGRLSLLRERLSGEVRLQTGEAFEVFQDRLDIAWGQAWQQRIHESLDAVTFLIPVITPAFFRSEPCRNELQHFLDHERRLGRQDLVLPLYYVESRVLSHEAQRAQDPLAQVIGARQLADWRDLRFEPMTSPSVARRLAEMALHIVNALDRAVAPVQPVRPAMVPASANAPLSSSPAQVPPVAREEPQPAGRTGPTPQTQPPILVVDALHRGDHASIGEALKAAKPGTRILVRPGLYCEGLVVDKPVEIIGDGPAGELVIEARGQDAVLFEASVGRIANLALRQRGGGKWYGVDIAQGRLELEDCDITSESLACVAIHGGADPRLRSNRIHDGKSAGVFVFENGQGTLEDNDIFANGLSGVGISEGANPTLRRNRIHDGKAGGVFVYENGQGTLEDNDIFANALACVQIKTGGNPTLRRNRMHDGNESGVYVYENGQGTLQDNDIFANANDGVYVSEGASPTVLGNRVNKNGRVGIRVSANAGGRFENNDLRNNAGGPWQIAPEAEPKVKRSGNLER